MGRPTRARVLREQLITAKTELTRVGELLATQRQSATDDALSVGATAAAETAREVGVGLQAVEAELVGVAPMTVAEELDDAVRCHDALVLAHEELGEQLRDTTAH